MIIRTNNPQEFLNSLEPNEVSDFLAALNASGSYLHLVNFRLVSSTLDLDQLTTMKSIR